MRPVGQLAEVWPGRKCVVVYGVNWWPPLPGEGGFLPPQKAPAAAGSQPSAESAAQLDFRQLSQTLSPCFLAAPQVVSIAVSHLLAGAGAGPLPLQRPAALFASQPAARSLAQWDFRQLSQTEVPCFFAAPQSSSKTASHWDGGPGGDGGGGDGLGPFPHSQNV